MTKKKTRPTVASLAKELVTLRENAALRDRKHDSLVRALGGHNPDPRGLYAIQELERQLRGVNDKTEFLNRQVADARARENKRVDKLEEVARITRTLGPLWKTQNGHRVPILMLSTEHLDRLAKGSWVKNPATKDAIETELDRRRVDAEWRKGEHTPWCGGSFEEPELTPDQIKIAELVERVTGVEDGLMGTGRQADQNRTRIESLEDDIIEDDVPHVGDKFISHLVFPHKCKHVLTDAEAILPDDVVDLYGEDMVATIARGPVSGVSHIRYSPRPKNEKPFKKRKRKRKSRIAAAWRAFWKTQSDLGCAG